MKNLLKNSRLYDVFIQEEIHKDTGAFFVVAIFVMTFAVLADQYGWSADNLAYYYANGGMRYSFFCVVLLPAGLALFFGIVNMLFALSVPSRTKFNP